MKVMTWTKWGFKVGMGMTLGVAAGVGVLACIGIAAAGGYLYLTKRKEIK